MDEICRAVDEELRKHQLEAPEGFIRDVAERIRHDADPEWNTDDVTIAIRNEINDMIQKKYNC